MPNKVIKPLNDKKWLLRIKNNRVKETEKIIERTIKRFKETEDDNRCCIYIFEYCSVLENYLRCPRGLE